jgi:uncharacterized protein YuzE
MATTLKSSTRDFVVACSAMASDMLRVPASQVWVDYDRDADVLYMSFRKPQGATRTIELYEDTLVRKDGRRIVGLTLMNASTRHRTSPAAARHRTKNGKRKNASSPAEARN